MQAFTLDDLRNHPEAVLEEARSGHISFVHDGHGAGFVTVPMDEMALRNGTAFAVATRLFEQGAVSLGFAAQLAGMAYGDFLYAMNALAIPVINLTPEELDEELRSIRVQE